MGSTCWRDTSRHTFEPNEANMWVNSTPVTPDPMMMACSGISAGGYDSRVVSTRSPSTVTKSGIRGRDPVATSTMSASSSSSPSAVSTTIVCGSLKRATPISSRTPWEVRRVHS